MYCRFQGRLPGSWLAQKISSSCEYVIRAGSYSICTDSAWSPRLRYVGFFVAPPVYPTRVRMTPGRLPNRESGPQNQPRANVAVSVFTRGTPSIGGTAAPAWPTRAKIARKPRMKSSLISSYPRFHEDQGGRVHAVPQAGRLRAVLEDVAEMRIAPGAHHLRAGQPEAVVGSPPDVLLGDGRPEAGPTGPRIVLRIRKEEVVPAADAPVDSLLVVIDVLPAIGFLGPFLTGHHVLQGGQLLLPLRRRLHHFGGRDEPLLLHGIHLDVFRGFRHPGSLPSGCPPKEKRSRGGKPELQEIGPAYVLVHKRIHAPAPISPVSFIHRISRSC